jgi:hypothetical protein
MGHSLHGHFHYHIITNNVYNFKYLTINGRVKSPFCGVVFSRSKSVLSNEVVMSSLLCKCTLETRCCPLASCSAVVLNCRLMTAAVPDALRTHTSSHILVFSEYPRTTLQPRARACDHTSILISVHHASRVSGSSKFVILSSNLTDLELTVPPGTHNASSSS